MRAVASLLKAVLGALPWLLALVSGGKARRKSAEVENLKGALKKKEVEDEVGSLTESERIDRLRKWDQQ